MLVGFWQLVMLALQEGMGCKQEGCRGSLLQSAHVDEGIVYNTWPTKLNAVIPRSAMQPSAGAVC